MPEPITAPSRPIGLLVNDHPIPLRGVHVDASIQDFCVQVTMTQRYTNGEPDPVEAVYVFPIDEAAAVCGFAVLIDGVEILGEVQQRDQAFETYDDALASGHGAYLLDQERPDVFTASIGNLPPGKDVLIRLTYVSELPREGDGMRFVLPTTVSPRYAPDEDRRGVGRSASEAVSPSVHWKVPYGVELELSIDMATSIRSLESPSHPIAVEITGSTGKVRLGEKSSAMDRDFVLVVHLDEAEKPRAWIERTAEGERVAMVAFQPSIEAERGPCEIVFLIDRSGSMDGSSIAEAKNALELCLRSLDERAYFNIVGFGSTHQSLFTESLPYGEQSLAEASRHVQDLRADLGGTEILPALAAILEKPVRPGLARQVLLLTDGQVSNTEAVIAKVREHSATTRVFTFGIGAGASHHLVRGIARAGEGVAELIAPGERIEGKVLRQLKRALVPAMTEVRLDWGGLRVRQAPHRIPPVFADGRLVVYGFLEPMSEKDLAGERTLELSAVSPAGKVSFRVPLSSDVNCEGALVATLAARAMLRDLEDGASALHDGGSLQKRGQVDRVEEEAVRLGVQYGLVSRWTSYVAVEQRDEPVTGEAKLRQIPVALTRGWGGSDGLVGGSLPLMMSRAPSAAFAPTEAAFDLEAPPASATLSADEDIAVFSPKRMLARFRGVSTRRSPSPGRPLAESAASGGVAKRPLDRLVLLQRADGSWELDDALARAVERDLATLEDFLPEFTGERDLARAAWATAIAIDWLRENEPDAEGEWGLLVAKAENWLARCPSRPASGDDWLAVTDVLA